MLVLGHEAVRRRWEEDDSLRPLIMILLLFFTDEGSETMIMRSEMEMEEGADRVRERMARRWKRQHSFLKFFPPSSSLGFLRGFSWFFLVIPSLIISWFFLPPPHPREVVSPQSFSISFSSPHHHLNITNGREWEAWGIWIDEQQKIRRHKRSEEQKPQDRFTLPFPVPSRSLTGRDHGFQPRTKTGRHEAHHYPSRTLLVLGSLFRKDENCWDQDEQKDQ